MLLFPGWQRDIWKLLYLFAERLESIHSIVQTAGSLRSSCVNYTRSRSFRIVRTFVFKVETFTGVSKTKHMSILTNMVIFCPQFWEFPGKESPKLTTAMKIWGGKHHQKSVVWGE